MATRGRKTTTTPRKRTTRAQKIAEEAQTVGADVVPQGTIEVEVQARPAGEGAGAPPRDDIVIEHRIDQIEPVIDRGSQSLLTDWDLHLFNEGTHLDLWKKLGAHIVPGGGIFGVWAPNAGPVSVF